MSDVLETAKWLVEHGATGVLAVACVAEAYVINRLWAQREAREQEHTKIVSELQEARIDDIQAYTVRAEALHDKIYKTADDMKTLTEVIKERRTR